MPVVGNAECENKLRRTRLGYDFKLHSGFLCAGGEEGKDACKVCYHRLLYKKKAEFFLKRNHLLWNRVMVVVHWCVKAVVAGFWPASSAGVSVAVNTTHPAFTPRFPNSPTGSKRI